MIATGAAGGGAAGSAVGATPQAAPNPCAAFVSLQCMGIAMMNLCAHAFLATSTLTELM